MYNSNTQNTMKSHRNICLPFKKYEIAAHNPTTHKYVNGSKIKGYPKPKVVAGDHSWGFKMVLGVQYVI